uniref:Uncharacterized protein n=1 Tax=Moniliophthora roreri TaxID=221103 RepID=A0A0W0FA88_MONRR
MGLVTGEHSQVEHDHHVSIHHDDTHSRVSYLASHCIRPFAGFGNDLDIISVVPFQFQSFGTPQLHGPGHLLSNDDSPFFMLLEQLTSLLSQTSFPKLKYIRDLSEESDALRRGKRSLYYPKGQPFPPLPPSLLPDMSFTGRRRSSFSSWRKPRRSRSVSTLSLSLSSSHHHHHHHTHGVGGGDGSLLSGLPISAPGHLRLTRFWSKVLDRAGERGVYVEDWKGLNVTKRDLERWERGLGDI